MAGIDDNRQSFQTLLIIIIIIIIIILIILILLAIIHLSLNRFLQIPCIRRHEFVDPLATQDGPVATRGRQHAARIPFDGTLGRVVAENGYILFR